MTEGIASATDPEFIAHNVSELFTVAATVSLSLSHTSLHIIVDYNRLQLHRLPTMQLVH